MRPLRGGVDETRACPSPARGASPRINERIGRLKARHRRVAGYYKLDLTVEGERVVSVAFARDPAKGSMADLPGVYCLRTNLTDWDAERLENLYHADGSGSGVPLSEIRTRPAPHPPPRAQTHRHLNPAYQLVQIVAAARTRETEAPCAIDAWSPPPSAAPKRSRPAPALANLRRPRHRSRRRAASSEN